MTVMRILFTIAHYWRPPSLLQTAAGALCKVSDNRLRKLLSPLAPQHGSLRQNPSPRVNALTECISKIHTLFGPRQYQVDRPAGIAKRANEAGATEVDIVVCTSGRHHVLEKLPLVPGSFRRHESGLPPKFLSFECQRILAGELGRHDYYCFMEDDTILHDPWFFQKLTWFDKRFGSSSLLQPNRYDKSITGPVRKLYGDEVIREEVTQKHQDIRIDAKLHAEFMDLQIRFHRNPNPHSGCFFLTRQQLDFWSRRPGFGEPEESFVGPLESGASLGIMKTFKVYKPALENANFLEVEHFRSQDLNIENLNKRCSNSRFDVGSPRSRWDTVYKHLS
jgi:hypothetical protein